MVRNAVAEREGDKIRIYVPEPNEANTLEVVLDLNEAYTLMVDVAEALDNWQPVEEEPAGIDAMIDAAPSLMPVMGSVSHRLLEV